MQENEEKTTEVEDTQGPDDTEPAAAPAPEPVPEAAEIQVDEPSLDEDEPIETALGGEFAPEGSQWKDGAGRVYTVTDGKLKRDVDGKVLTDSHLELWTFTPVA